MCPALSHVRAHDAEEVEETLDAAPAAVSLLEGCQRGEPAAWRTLFQRFVRSVYRWATCFGLDRLSAEEVAQRVFATACQSIHKCESEQLLPGWLFQITRRHAANQRRNAWLRRV